LEKRGGEFLASRRFDDHLLPPHGLSDDCADLIRLQNDAMEALGYVESQDPRRQ